MRTSHFQQMISCGRRFFRSLASTACSLLCILLVAAPAGSQQATSIPSKVSDLAALNLNRVGASASQIEEVLRKDPGLMVELKRIVAKEATDHGQILEDSDLTDVAVIARLADDPEFRSVATRLLQRYGYLLPTVNPSSDFAKEQELLRAERAFQLQQARARGNTAEGSFETPGKPPTQHTAPSPNRRPLLPEDSPLIRPPQERPLLPTATGFEQRLTHASFAPTTPPEQPTSKQFSSSPADQPASPFSPQTTGPESSRSWLAELNDRAGNQPAETAGVEPKRSLRSPRPTSEPAETAFLRTRNPYASIPSLYDLYRQTSPRSVSLDRFGLDLFRNTSGEADLLPIDLPVGPDYVLGPGDSLTIDLWGSVSQRLYRVVDRTGQVSLPEVGPLLVSGRSLGEVQQAVQQILRTQFRDVSADLSLARLRTTRVYVVGDVERPGAYDISSLSTPLNALLTAGGPTPRGSLRLIRHLRGNTLIQEVDIYDLLLRGVRSDLKRLESGDTLLVPPLGPQVTIEGAVRRPALYEFRNEASLTEVLALAGGLLPTSTLNNVQIERVEAHERRTMLQVSLPATPSSEETVAASSLNTFRVADGDVIRVLPIAPYNQQAIYLEGHVLRPGRYSFRPGMRLTDIVASYSDLLPEPASHYAEIIRLRAPDFRPAVEGFDLSTALKSPDSAPSLEPLDTIRIFSRFDFEDPPAVWVGGEVRNPGPYQTPGQIHLRDAILLAGGLTADALPDHAQVFRRLPDSRLKIISVNLTGALSDMSADNIPLEPHDRIVVHRNPLRADPASVFIRGEVAKPGRYPLTSNFHVADLIRLAGGLKRSAYPETADLIRYNSGDPNHSVENQEIVLASALEGDTGQNLQLRDGDTLTIRQLSGWRDIGATVIVNGEVEHPGNYGIRTGERLSSLLRRVGGFNSTAYPQAAVLERIEVRNLQERSKQELINRMEQESSDIKVSPNESAQDRATLQQAVLQQRDRVISRLRQLPVSGRLVIRLRHNLNQFENSADDIELRPGDRLTVPKQPNFILVTGQVYNANAIVITPGKNAGWYLQQAGGPTDLANRKAIFVIRADGSVVTGNSGGWWNSDNVLSRRMEPGDTLVVPERPLGNSSFWKSAITMSQVVSSFAVTAAVVTR